MQLAAAGARRVVSAAPQGAIAGLFLTLKNRPPVGAAPFGRIRAKILRRQLSKLLSAGNVE